MADWYIISTTSKTENKVKQAILKAVEGNNAQDMVEEIFIPVIPETVIKNGKKHIVEKEAMTRYVYIKMDMNPRSLEIVRKAYKNIKFLGATSPAKITQQEIDRIYNNVAALAKKASVQHQFAIGETVDVISGLLENFSGVIDGIDLEKQRITLSVAIFGTSTSVELGFSEVRKKVN